jgi:hypothetical protein
MLGAAVDGAKHSGRPISADARHEMCKTTLSRKS